MVDYNWPQRNRQGTFTSKWKLYQPKVGEIGWGEDVDINFTIIDEHLGNRISELKDVTLGTGLTQGDILIYSPIGSTPNWANLPYNLLSLRDVDPAPETLTHGSILRYYKPDGATNGIWKVYPYMNNWDQTAPANLGDIWMYVKVDPENADPAAPKIWRPVAPAYLKTDGTNQMTGSLNLGGNRLINLVDPVDATDGVTKQYVDQIQSKYWKDSVKGFFDPNSYDAHFPPAPLTGDRYISNASKDDGSTAIVKKNAIYTYDGTTWIEYIPTLGIAVYVDADKCPYTFNDEVNTIDPLESPAGGTSWAPVKGSGGGTSDIYIRKANTDTITAQHIFSVGDKPVFTVDTGSAPYAIYEKNTIKGVNVSRLSGISKALFSWGHNHPDDEVDPVYPWGIPEVPGSNIELAIDPETGEPVPGVKGINADLLDGYHYYDIINMIEAKDDVWVRKTEYNYLHLMPLLMVEANTALWKPGSGEFGCGLPGLVAQYLFDDLTDEYVHASYLVKKTDVLDHGVNLSPASLKDDDHIQYLPITSERAERHIGPEFQGTLLCTDLYLNGIISEEKVIEGDQYRSIYGVNTPYSGDPTLQDKISHAVATKGYVDQVSMGVAWWEPVVALVDEPPQSPNHGDRYVIHGMKRVSDIQHPTNLLWGGSPRVWDKTAEIPETYINIFGTVLPNPFYGHKNCLAIYDETLNNNAGGWIVEGSEPAPRSSVYADLIKEQYTYNDADDEWYLFQKLGSHQDLVDRSHPDAHTQYINRTVPNRAIMQTDLTLTHYEYGGVDNQGKNIYTPIEWNVKNLGSPRPTPFQNATTDLITPQESLTFYNFKKDPTSVKLGIGYQHNKDAVSKQWVEKRLPNSIVSSGGEKYKAIRGEDLPSNPPNGTRAIVTHRGLDINPITSKRPLISSMPNCILEWHKSGVIRENDPWSGGWWYQYTPDKGQILYMPNDDSKPDGEYLIFDDYYTTAVKDWIRGSTSDGLWCPYSKYLYNGSVLCREPLGGRWENLGVSIRHEALRNNRMWNYNLRYSATPSTYTIREFYVPNATNGGYPAAPTNGMMAVPTRTYPETGTALVKAGYLYQYDEGAWVEIAPDIGVVIYCAGANQNYVYSASENLVDENDPAYGTNWMVSANRSYYRRRTVDYDPAHPETYDNIGIEARSGADSSRNPDGINLDTHHQYMRVDGTRHEVRHHRYPVKHNPYIGKTNFPASADPFDPTLRLPSYKDIERYVGYEGSNPSVEVTANLNYFSVPHDSLRWLDDVMLAENESGGVDRFGRYPLSVPHMSTLIYWNNPDDPADPRNKKWINASPPQGVQHHYQLAQDEREDHPTSTNLTDVEKISHHQYVRVNLDGIVPVYPNETYDPLNPQGGMTSTEFSNAKVIDFSTLWINEWNKIYNNGVGGTSVFDLRYGGDRGDQKALTYTTHGSTKGERTDGHKATGIHRILPPTTNNENAWAWGDAYYGYIPHDRLEGLVNVWTRPERIPIQYMQLPLDLDGKYYYRPDGGSEQYVTGAQLIAMGHITGEGLIDPTDITHYDGRIDNYSLQYIPSIGQWVPCNQDSTVNLPEHDVLEARNLHSNHPFYLERGLHNAKLQYDTTNHRHGIRNWTDHFGVAKTAIQYEQFFNPYFEAQSTYSIAVHEFGPKFEVGGTGNVVADAQGNLPHDEISGLRDVLIYSNSGGSDPYPKYRISPVTWPTPDPEDLTPPDYSFEFGNALAEGHILQFHNGRWMNRLLPSTPQHNQLNGREAANAHPQYIEYLYHNAIAKNTTGSISGALADAHAYYSDFHYARAADGQLLEAPTGYEGEDAIDGYYIIPGNLPHDSLFRQRDVSFGNPNGLAVGSLPSSPEDQKTCTECGTYNEAADPDETWICPICSHENTPDDSLSTAITKDGYFLTFKWIPFIDGYGKTYYKHRIVLSNSAALPPGFTVDHKNLSGLSCAIAGWTPGHTPKTYEGDHHPQYLGNVAGWGTTCYAVHTFMGNPLEEEPRTPFRVDEDATAMVVNLCAHYLGDGTAVTGRRTAADFALKGHTHSLGGSNATTGITDVKLDNTKLVKGQILSYTDTPETPGINLWRNVTIESLRPRLNDLLDTAVEDRTYFVNAKMGRFLSDPIHNNYAAGSLMIYGDPHIDGERERTGNQNSVTMWQPLLPPDPSAIGVNVNRVLTFSFYDSGDGQVRPWMRWADAATGSGTTVATALSSLSDVNPAIDSAQQFSLFYKGAGAKWTGLERAYDNAELADPINMTERTRTLLTKYKINPDTGLAYLTMAWGQQKLTYSDDVLIEDIETTRDGSLLYLATEEGEKVWKPLEVPELIAPYDNRSLQVSYDGEDVTLRWDLTDHNGCKTLQGGDDNQYYHLTSPQHTALTSGECNLHQHDERYYTKSNLQTGGEAEVHWENITHICTSAGDAENRIRNGKFKSLNEQSLPYGWTVTSTDPASGTFTRSLTIDDGSGESHDYNILNVRLTHSDTGNANTTWVNSVISQTLVDFSGTDKKLYFEMRSLTGCTTATAGKGVTTTLKVIFDDGTDHIVNVDTKTYGVVNTDSTSTYTTKTVDIPSGTADIVTVKIVAEVAIGGTATVTDIAAGIAQYWIKDIRSYSVAKEEFIAQIRTDTATTVLKSDPILLKGEAIHIIDGSISTLKIGDGVRKCSELPPIGTSADIDYGDLDI